METRSKRRENIKRDDALPEVRMRGRKRMLCRVKLKV